MTTVSLAEAQAQLPALIEKVAAGQEIVITRDDAPIAQVLPIRKTKPHHGSALRHAHHRQRRRRAPGRLQGVHALRLLLDTHTFRWFTLGDPQISRSPGPDQRPRQRQAGQPSHLLGDRHQGEHQQAGPGATLRGLPPPRVYVQQRLRHPARRARHTAVVATLPFHHKDPFDRLLIAQALAEDIATVSNEASSTPTA